MIKLYTYFQVTVKIKRQWIHFCKTESLIALKDVHGLIPAMDEYITFHGKRDFTNVIYLRI